ncbi:O-antigen ligase family protein [Emticicia sp. SJ17W-69]|uniref:O-antigen ligase family protein n=1 Tax=Emticicia sp. SJ17W-69 TaxID=3421657 RepID=UPI003EB99268
MLEIALFSIVVLSAIFIKKESLILLLIFFLPFHSFIKSFFQYFFNGGNIISVWKEVVILILLFKINKNHLFKSERLIKQLIYLFFSIVVLYFITTDNLINAIPTLRDHLFPIFLFMSLLSMQISKEFFTRIILFLAITAFINVLMGFLQSFMFNIEISQLMGSIDFIDDNGYVKYKTSSARILGIERMAGILGGPNVFGVYMSFMIVIISALLLNKEKGFLSKRIIFLLLFLMSICLLFSFSRAGFFIAISGVMLLLYFNKTKNIGKTIIGLSFFSIVLSFIIFTYFPEKVQILELSLSSKEASAADRDDNFMKGITTIIEEPFGHGVGTTDNRNKGYKNFFESAILNITFEIGFLGIAIWICLHLFIVFKIWQKYNNRANIIVKIALAISLPLIVTSFFSINTYGMPIIYFWWICLGLGLSSMKTMTNVSQIKQNATLNNYSNI